MLLQVPGSENGNQKGQIRVWQSGDTIQGWDRWHSVSGNGILYRTSYGIQLSRMYESRIKLLVRKPFGYTVNYTLIL